MYIVEKENGPDLIVIEILFGIEFLRVKKTELDTVMKMMEFSSWNTNK